MNEVFNKWREAIEYAEQRRGVRDGNHVPRHRRRAQGGERR